MRKGILQYLTQNFKKIFKHRILFKKMTKIDGLLYKTLFFIALFFILCYPFVSGDIKTSTEISNSFPYLIKNIPNLSMGVNSYSFGAFDLDEYFFDDNGDALLYGVSGNSNIAVVIDNSTHSVSFYPSSNFVGVEQIYFYASDGSHNVSSNIIFIFVGLDLTPPKWIFQNMDRSEIRQNDRVEFSAHWEDDYALKSFVFSINQGRGWANSSAFNFSGLQNISIYSEQINAAEGQRVYWRFYAYDSSNNLNQTEIANFSVLPNFQYDSNYSLPQGSTLYSEGRETSFLESFFSPRKKVNITLDVSYLKISLLQGEETTRVIRITNLANSLVTLNLSIIGIQEYFIISEGIIEIPSGETQTITLDAKIKKNELVGQYFGSLIIDYGEKILVPIILDIRAANPVFEIKVNLAEKKIRPGEEIKANLTVKNLLEPFPSNITLYSSLKNLHGRIYDSYEQEYPLSGSLSVDSAFIISEDMPDGEYLFYARVFDGRVFAIDSDIFSVGYQYKLSAIFKYSFIFLSIFILAAISSFLFARYKREVSRRRVLNLYLMLNELKDLLQKKDFKAASELYLRLKSSYGEPVANDSLGDPESLKKQMSDLADKLSENLEKQPPSNFCEPSAQKEDKIAPGNSNMENEEPLKFKDLENIKPCTDKPLAMDKLNHPAKKGSQLKGGVKISRKKYFKHKKGTEKR